MNIMNYNVPIFSNNSNLCLIPVSIITKILEVLNDKFLRNSRRKGIYTGAVIPNMFYAFFNLFYIC